MNYFPFHIGDYASATRHLSWDEDLAYRRLLDVYYTTEKPLPTELRQVYRVVMATTESQREAVETVLKEFFKLTEEGWVNTRADEEIAVMKEKQAANDSRDAHERERMRRHRERRAEMFEALRSVGVVPAWDVSIKELQRLFDENCNVAKDDLQRSCNVSGNGPETAIPTPTPTPTPTPIVVVGAKRATALPEGFEPNDAGTEKALSKGLNVQAELERFRDYHAAKGSTMKDWQAAWRTWVGNARAPVAVPAKRPSGPVPKWALDAGFPNVWEAESCGCFQHNAHEFHNGTRGIEA